MKITLSAFCVQNFRSVVNSGWRSLSSDNITILIGQNESGKTSVLEALESFYKGKINDDVLRSDNSLPKISCSFLLEKHNVLKLLNQDKIPESLKDILRSHKEFKLIREWQEDKTSRLSVTDNDIFDYFDKIQRDKDKIRDKTLIEIESLFSSNEQILRELEESEREKEKYEQKVAEVKKHYEQKRKQLRKFRKTAQKVVAEKELEFAREKLENTESDFREKVSLFQKISEKSQELTERIIIGKNCQNAINSKNDIELDKSDNIQRIAELEHLYGLTSTAEGKQKVQNNIEKVKEQLNKTNIELQNKTREVELSMLIATKVYLNDINTAKAEIEARKELENSEDYYNMYTLAEDLFKYVPVFEFFEDFSGLLPNKIDLEDLLNENKHVEGYKAAYNFLQLAGLDSAFFREKNQRILKQRIETLNSDVTINFQDYWSQQVGKDNKIKLHFELEHYDYTIPEKSGKPYMEFWIKDNKERLYPKQRSRGVRWFLSFYLELKATAIGANKNRVLLIDEPGLSLHARAQEDVLKVFEDLKDSMQIIYCTHSPHLVKSEKLYRVLAVQRANLDDDSSESVVYEPSGLSEVSADTLTPIYSLMGVHLSDQQLIQFANNIIVPDTITYYYLHWLAKLFPEYAELQFIPSTGKSSVPLLINILAGWQLNFGSILFGADSEETYNEILETTLLSEDKSRKRVSIFKDFDMIEDVFSALDFKKFILQKRVGITEKNSEYILINSLSRKILATNFVNNFNEGKIKLDILDDTSRTNIKNLFSEITMLLKT